jgi:hypothetical protein
MALVLKAIDRLDERHGIAEFRDQSVTTDASRRSVHPLLPAQTYSEPAGLF